MTKVRDIPLIILAGGRATRLGGASDDLPKFLMPVIEGDCFADIQLRWVRRQGFRKIILSLGYRAQQIMEYCGDGSRFGLEIAYCLDGDSPLGTAGAVRESAALVPSRYYAVIYGDTLLDFPTQETIHKAVAHEAFALMTVMKNFPSGNTANAQLNNDGELQYDKFSPEMTWNYIDYGFLVLSEAFMDSIPAGGGVDLSIPLQGASKCHRLRGFSVTNPFFEINTPENITKLAQHLKTVKQQLRGLVICDRDGVLNQMTYDPEHGLIDSPLHPSQVQAQALVADSIALSLKDLNDLGWGVAIATNQPAARKRKTTMANLLDTHDFIVDACEAKGGRILSSHLCFDLSSEGSLRRKPHPEMLFEAMKQNADYSAQKEVWMVGDGITDVEAGVNAGVKTAFLAPQKCDLCVLFQQKKIRPDLWVDSFADFVQILLNRGEHEIKH